MKKGEDRSISKANNVFKIIGLTQHYTNINFTDKQLENIPKLYDMLMSSGLLSKILELIPVTEYFWIEDTLEDTVKSIYQYQNSVFGILDTVTTDYDNLNFDVKQLQENISNPENLTLLKDVMTKLG